MHIAIYAFCASLELPLLALHKIFPQTHGYLPVGGDEFSQMAILLMTAFFISQVILITQSVIKAIRRKKSTP
jgi:hypothetical protein